MFCSGQEDCPGPVLPLPSLPLATRLVGKINMSGPSLFLPLQLPVGVWILSADLNHQRGWLVMGWLSLLPKQSFEMELPWSAALLEHEEKDR